MKGSLKKLLTRIAKGQGGFTLIEMIVVVGIIAVLAAVIVPNIGKFIGTGERGAQEAEQGSVETAMSAMMAEESIIAVVANATTSTNVWSSNPTGGVNVRELYDTGDANFRYLKVATTTYFYCYDIDGNVTNSLGGLSRLSAVACD